MPDVVSRLSVKPLHPLFVAEITGIDVKRLSNSEWDAVRSAFAEHGVVFFRDQDLTPDQHLDFARKWAPIDVNRFFTAVDGYPEIAEVRKHGGAIVLEDGPEGGCIATIRVPA